MNGQEAKKTLVMQTFTDLVTLVYHEGRNVRHLVKDGRIDEPKRYSRLINLPCNRVGAWRVLQKLRDAARARADVTQVERVYSRHFGLTLEEMKRLFEHQGWRHSKSVGGNKWAAITDSVVQLRNALVDGRIEEAKRVADRTLSMCHNTGRVSKKLEDLDSAIRK